MAKKLLIPVELEFNLDAVNKIGGILNKALSSSKTLFTDDQKIRAKELLSNIDDISKNYQKAAEGGKMTKNLYYAFRDQFDDVSKDAKKLGIDISKELKENARIFFSEDETKEIDKIKNEIDDLEQKLLRLKESKKTQKGGLNFREILGMSNISNMAGFEDLNMGQYKNLESSDKELERRQLAVKALYDGVKRRRNDNPEKIELANKLKLYEALRAEILTQQAITEAAETGIQNAMSETKQKIVSKKEELEKVTEVATEQSKTFIEGVKQQANTIDQNSKKLNFLRAMGLDGEKVDLVGGFFTGIQNEFKDFIGGITSGLIVLEGLRRVFTQTVKTIRELDAAFNEIAKVTTYTTEEVWKMRGAFVEIAKTTGLSVVDVTKLAGEFFRQGRSLSETLKLTEAAGIAASVAGITAANSVNYLTSAVNGYKLSADQAMSVSDKFAALAASSATDYEELAIALSKVAAQAYSAGVDMDNLMGFIAKALETTREAPENIGTAFKTIFARMSEITEYGKTLEDGMDVNRIDKALSTVGVSLTDQNNELRNLDEVLIEVGKGWSSLNKNQKAYLATALAGTRQQTRLLAVFEDFDRTMELAEASANSLGATFAQQEKYYNSIAYAQSRLTIAWEEFLSSLGSSDVFILVYNTASGLIGVLNSTVSVLGKFGSAVNFVVLGTLAAAVAMSVFGKKAIIATIATKGLTGGLTAQNVATASLTVLTNALTAAYKGAAFAAKSLGIALFSNPIIAAATILVAALVAVSVAVDAASKKHNKFAESMRKTQAEIFNLRKEADSLETLLERYNKLENSITKTNESREEQNQLIQQMQDLLGDDSQALDLTGKFNADVILNKIENLRKEADKVFNDSISKAKATYSTLSDAYENQTDTVIRQQLLIQEAITSKIETADGDRIESYSDFLDLSAKERQFILDSAKLRLESFDKFVKTVETLNIDAGVYENILSIDTTKVEEANKILQEFYNQDFSDGSLTEQILVLEDLNFSTWSDAMKEAIIGVSPELENLTGLMSKFGTDLPGLKTIIAESTLSEQDIIRLNTALEKTGIDIDKQTHLLKAFMKEGDDFKVIAEYADEYGLSIFEVADLTQQLSDAMSDVSFNRLHGEIKTLQSVSSNLERVNNMLTGGEAYDLIWMQEMINMYPQIGAAIAANGQISSETEKGIRQTQRETLLQNIDTQIAQLENNIETNKLKIAAYEDMLIHENLLAEVSGKTQEELNAMTIDEMEQAYADFVSRKVELEALGSKEVATNHLRIQKIVKGTSEAEYQTNLRILNSTVNSTSREFKNLFNTMSKGSGGSGTTFTEKINIARQSLKDANDTTLAQIQNLQFLKENIDRVIGSIEKGTDSTKKGTDANKEYKASLDEIYNIQQALIVLQQKLEEVRSEKESTEGGEEYIKLLLTENEVIEQQVIKLRELTAAQKRVQNSLVSGLRPALASVVRIINGRMNIVVSRFSKLSGENQEIVEELVKTYNSYGDSINDNTNSLNEYNAALKENNKIIRDSLIEAQKLILEAYRNAEKKKLDIFLKGLEEERKLLDKRKAMYDKAFAEEDHTNSLQEMSKKRQEIITKLAALEGATDLTSAQRRKELNEELTDLNRDYNITVRDYNRQALLDSIDTQTKQLEAQKSSAEEAYEALMKNTAYLEEKITEIMKGGVDNIIAYVKEHLPEYSEAFSLEKDEIEEQWRLIAEKGLAAKHIIEGNLPDLSPFKTQLQDIIAQYNQLMADAKNASSRSTAPPGPTSPPPSQERRTRRIVYRFDGKEYATQKEADQAKAAKISSIERSLTALSLNLRQNVPSHVRSAIQVSIQKQRKDLTKYQSMKVVSASKGSILDYTGLAMVHGTPSKPERVLSPVQTELFDRMVGALEAKSNNSTSSLITPEGINIGEINITTNQLNNTQDFKAAGRTLAEAIMEAKNTRGIAINKKR